MDRSPPNVERFVDVTGLPEEVIRAVEGHVAALRVQMSPARRYHSHEEWSKALHEWVNSHPRRDTFADWSRESIYAGRGE
jgi:hypothetical protein